MSQVRITLRRSLAGRSSTQQAIVRTLGLRRIGQAVERTRSARLEGMLRRVAHLVEVRETDGRGNSR